MFICQRGSYQYGVYVIC